MKEILRVTVTSKKGLEKLETLKKRKEDNLKELKADYDAGKFDEYFKK